MIWDVEEQSSRHSFLSHGSCHLNSTQLQLISTEARTTLQIMSPTTTVGSTSDQSGSCMVISAALATRELWSSGSNPEALSTALTAARSGRGMKSSHDDYELVVTA